MMWRGDPAKTRKTGISAAKWMDTDRAVSAQEIITIRKARMKDVQRRIRLEISVNDEGRARPRFFLAPKKAPEYFEPDRATYNVYIPDLECRPTFTPHAAATPKHVADAPTRLGLSGLRPPMVTTGECFALDFGTSMTCIRGVDLGEATNLIQLGRPLLSLEASVSYQGSGLRVNVEADFRSPVAAFTALEPRPELGGTVYRLLVDGHYVQAVFEACKIVEQIVKEKAGQPKDSRGNELYGRQLMGRVFSSDNPLISLSSDGGLQDAYRDLFSGLMGVRGGLFAHGRQSELTAWRALMWLGLADLLLKEIFSTEQKSTPIEVPPPKAN